MTSIFETNTLDELKEYIDIQFEVSHTFSHTHGDLFAELLAEANNYFNKHTFFETPEKFEQNLLKFMEVIDPHMIGTYQHYYEDNPDIEKLDTQFSTLMIDIINNTDSLVVYDCVNTSHISFDLAYFVLKITDLTKIEKLRNRLYVTNAYFALTNAIMSSNVSHINVDYKMKHLTKIFKEVYSLSEAEQLNWFDEHFSKIVIDYISFVSNNIDAIVQFNDDLKYYICASFSLDAVSDFISNIASRAAIISEFKSAMFGERFNSLDRLAESLNSADSPSFWKGADLKLDKSDLTTNIIFFP